MLWQLNLLIVLHKYFFLHALLSIFVSIVLSEIEGQLYNQMSILYLIIITV